MSDEIWLSSKNNLGLVHALMKEFSNDGFISFEGGSTLLPFSKIRSASIQETSVLRKTGSAEYFFVISLTDETIGVIYEELKNNRHLENFTPQVQLESKGKLVFGGYDDFDECATFVSEEVPKTLLLSLVNKEIIGNLENA